MSIIAISLPNTVATGDWVSFDVEAHFDEEGDISQFPLAIGFVYVDGPSDAVEVEVPRGLGYEKVGTVERGNAMSITFKSALPACPAKCTSLWLSDLFALLPPPAQQFTARRPRIRFPETGHYILLFFVGYARGDARYMTDARIVTVTVVKKSVAKKIQEVLLSPKTLAAVLVGSAAVALVGYGVSHIAQIFKH